MEEVAQTEDLATYGLKELCEIIEDENITDTDLMSHVDDSFKEESRKRLRVSSTKC